MLTEPIEEDELKRLRRVREELHNRFRTWKSFWAHLDAYARAHPKPTGRSVAKRSNRPRVRHRPVVSRGYPGTPGKTPRATPGQQVRRRG
jgi:hypothetical protein